MNSFLQIVGSVTPNLNIMEWPHPWRLCWVCRLAHHNELIGALHNIMGTSLTIPYYNKSKGPNGRDLAQGFLAFREFPEFPFAFNAKKSVQFCTSTVHYASLKRPFS